jgi:hypothetical protein
MKLRHQAIASFVIGAIVGVPLVASGVIGATPPTDAQRLEALWSACVREEVPECLELLTTPTPSATPSVEPSPTPSTTPVPPTAVPTSMPTPPAPPATPTASPTAAPTAPPTTTPPPSPTTDTVHLEAQAWWNTDGLDVPSAVGHHIHVEALNFPRPGRIVTGTYQLRVKVTLHEHDGRTNWIRYSDGSNVIDSIPLTLGPCHDCSTELTIPVDFGRFGTGIRELRLSVNIPDEQPAVSGSQRMFNSTGWPVAVRALSPSYRSAGIAHIESRGWYDDSPLGEDHGYQNQRADVAEVRAGQTIDIDIQPGAGGLPTVYSLVTVNPNMHGGVIGRVLLERAGEFHGRLTLPSDLAPGDKVAIVGHDGKNGGVLVLRVVP